MLLAKNEEDIFLINKKDESLIEDLFFNGNLFHLTQYTIYLLNHPQGSLDLYNMQGKHKK